MASFSKIEWTWTSWNPVTGCSKVSAGCQHCYAERMALRLQKMGQKKYRNGFKVTLHPDKLGEPLSWRKPRLVFVNSMSDLFHPEVDEGFILEVFDVMKEAYWHTFQVLTKRSRRMANLTRNLHLPDNVWMGVTVESRNQISRLDDLAEVPAAIRFVSMEPLLGPIDKFAYEKVDWVIVGGESGPGARPIQESWVISIRNQCLRQGIAFFFKQWGGVNKKHRGRLLEGKYWDQMPTPSSAPRQLVLTQLEPPSRFFSIPAP